MAWPPLNIITAAVAIITYVVTSKSEEEEQKRERKEARVRENQKTQERAAKQQRENEQKQRKKAIRQNTANLIDKYNLQNLDIDHMADLIETDSQQAANEFKTAYENSSESQYLRDKVTHLESQLKKIDQLSRVLNN